MLMKEIIPQPAPIVRNDTAAIQALFQKHVVPSYGRFDLVFSHGAGSYLWDVAGKRYLDFGGGIAVCALGHANSEITDTLIEQSRKLVHVSNLYYTEPQGRLAQSLVQLLGPGKCFFCNSGGEANEGLFKLARKFGHDEGRFEILTTHNSFHGRTLAGIAATGQEKVKKGFEPMVSGFRQVPYNDLEAIRASISPATAAILIEGIQGEIGITPASPDYLIGLRQLCDEKQLLLMMDGVQDGHFRTGRFQSFQRILENGAVADSNSRDSKSATSPRSFPSNFLPDAVSMAKSIAGGFPMGAFWIRQPFADLLGPGTHASTFGGTPLACAVALKVLEVIHRDNLADNARRLGDFLKAELSAIAAKYPNVLKTVRGFGLMIGIELCASIPEMAKQGAAYSVQFVSLLHAAGLLTIPASTHVARLLPPLNLRRQEAEEGLKIIESVVSKLANGH